MSLRYEEVEFIPTPHKDTKVKKKSGGFYKNWHYSVTISGFTFGLLISTDYDIDQSLVELKPVGFFYTDCCESNFNTGALKNICRTCSRKTTVNGVFPTDTVFDVGAGLYSLSVADGLSEILGYEGILWGEQVVRSVDALVNDPQAEWYCNPSP